MKNYQQFAHTADIGICIKAPTLKSLFKKAAAAMFDLMVEKARLPGNVRRETMSVHLKAETLDELLRTWLSEILSLSECRELIFTDFKFKQFDERSLQAEVIGVPREFFRYKREIKAVTFHELQVRKEKHQYVARVIFDV